MTVSKGQQNVCDFMLLLLGSSPFYRQYLWYRVVYSKPREPGRERWDGDAVRHSTAVSQRWESLLKELPFLISGSGPSSDKGELLGHYQKWLCFYGADTKQEFISTIGLIEFVQITIQSEAYNNTLVTWWDIYCRPLNRSHGQRSIWRIFLAIMLISGNTY